MTWTIISSLTLRGRCIGIFSHLHMWPLNWTWKKMAQILCLCSDDLVAWFKAQLDFNPFCDYEHLCRCITLKWTRKFYYQVFWCPGHRKLWNSFSHLLIILNVLSVYWKLYKLHWVYIIVIYILYLVDVWT